MSEAKAWPWCHDCQDMHLTMGEIADMVSAGTIPRDAVARSAQDNVLTRHGTFFYWMDGDRGYVHDPFQGETRELRDDELALLQAWAKPHRAH